MRTSVRIFGAERPMSQRSHILVRKASRVPYFRRSIPALLRRQFGRREFVCSLRTHNRSEATARAEALLAKSEELLRYALTASKARYDRTGELGMVFDRYREVICRAVGVAAKHDVSGQSTPRTMRERREVPAGAPQLRYVFLPSMTARLLGRHRAQVLAADDAWRRTLSPNDLQEARASLAAREQAFIDEIALSNLGKAWEGTAALMEREGVDSSLSSMTEMQSFVERFLRDELDVVRIRIARLNGVEISTPPLPRGALDEDEWEVIQTTWESVRLPKFATRYEAALAIKRLRECTRNKSPCDLTLADAMLFRSDLLRQLSRARAKSSFSLVRSILKTAAAENHIALNISLAFESVKIEVSDKAVHSYQPFSISQLQEFFDGPVHSGGLRPAKGGAMRRFGYPCSDCMRACDWRKQGVSHVGQSAIEREDTGSASVAVRRRLDSERFLFTERSNDLTLSNTLRVVGLTATPTSRYSPRFAQVANRT